MKYQKNVSISGAWAKSADIKSGIKALIVTETIQQPSTFLNKDGTPKVQDVAKVRFEGASDALNVSLNRCTLNALIEAFGEESADWQGHPLTVETEKMRVGGKAVTALYLIPDGFERIDNQDGYAEIVRKGTTQAKPESSPEDEITSEDIPF